jgi:hypothetical protein
VQLVLGDDTSSLETGKAHLYELLRQLSMVEPVLDAKFARQKQLIMHQDTPTILITAQEKEFNSTSATKIVAY